MSNRYEAGEAQGSYEPGSDDRVLRNKLGVTDPDEMDEVELQLLGQIYRAVLLEALPDRRLYVADLKTWHRRWLGNVYDWAGMERSVNMGKGDFHFAAATQVPRLLTVFEHDCLARFTPCHDIDDASLIEAIAMTHVELILIHPFREGNGRLSRLLADVMVVQAGRGPLDYSAWEADKAAYFGAIRAGMANDYRPMQRLVEAALVN
ncbi:Fic/DOC family protein [Rhodanobacter sp. FW102-FHT14D06]|uniref:Fic/DOC family protein n=2 Tax=unclassified Rhodanobacter TaxID=2621553 RepID=A0AB74UYA9_9GAMM